MAIRGLRVFALVPARGGSKGLPGKNLRSLAGRSLVEHAARVARSIEWIDRAILSSDDPQIAEVARAAGLEAPFLRPPELSNDTAKSIDVWRHAWLAIEAQEQRQYDLGVLLEPTSPMRRASDVVATIELLLDSGAGTAATVSPTPGHFTPHKTLTVDGNGRIGFFVPDGARFSRRQDIPSYFHRNGVCYAARRDAIVERRVIVDEDCVALVLDRPLVNIDSLADLEYAQYLMERVNDNGEATEASRTEKPL